MFTLASLSLNVWWKTYFLQKLKAYNLMVVESIPPLTLKHFLAQSGILHRISYPHTSQQNGVAERKHRHVMDIGLALHIRDSKQNIGLILAFLTAIYLINRLPTPTLSNETPILNCLTMPLTTTSCAPLDVHASL